ncbi:LOB domain-containing protein 19 [Lactuca sativa]|uniref:LOB domain-containing protein 19 n=1 Tax=Lactuca sativa TaxID=4236 RepID=UPI000CC8EF87|nr:LOB domain-containing protein 19 [Lactuca sativa]
MSRNCGGPCGACKFLRRKCAKGCVFAPYFEPDDRGLTDFEAVHRVFGAKNAAKLLLRTPENKRLDAVVSLCYEALSRVRDPVYGCVGRVFNLQQQVEKLQAELAYVQARVSILKHHPSSCQPATNRPMLSTETLISSSMLSCVHFGVEQPSPVTLTPCFSRENDASIEETLFEEDNIEMLARELLSKYLPVSKIRHEKHDYY